MDYLVTGLSFGSIQGVNLCEEWFDFELPFDVGGSIHTANSPERWINQNSGKFVRLHVMEGRLPPSKSVIFWSCTHPVQCCSVVFFSSPLTDIYIDVRASSSVEENTRCSCKCPIDLRGSGCGDDCLNRIMQQECSPETCPCGERCSNQRLQKRFWISELERFMTQSRGWGIRTNMAIKHGEFIMEYLGEVISMNEFWRRAHKDYQHCKHHYFLMLDSGTVIDGYSSGSEARFVNHSCEPNCEMQKWYVNGVYRIGMFALRDIPSGEELTYDYNFHAFQSRNTGKVDTIKLK
ncbi:hypothetical protein BSL78_16771, partial [Apostichopus japonicus]